MQLCGVENISFMYWVEDLVWLTSTFPAGLPKHRFTLLVAAVVKPGIKPEQRCHAVLCLVLAQKGHEGDANHFVKDINAGILTEFIAEYSNRAPRELVQECRHGPDRTQMIGLTKGQDCRVALRVIGVICDAVDTTYICKLQKLNK